MGKQKTRKSPESDASEERLDLEKITVLGGEKKDLDLIYGIVDGDEAIDCSEDLEAEPIRKDELKDFIEELGFNKIMNFIEEDLEPPSKKSKKKKSKKEAGDEEEAEESQSKKKKSNLSNLEGHETGSEDDDDVEIKKSSKKPSKKKEEPSSNETPESTASTEESKKKKKKNKFKIQDEQISSTTVETDLGYLREYQPRKYLLIKPGTKWLDSQFPDDPDSVPSLTDDQVREMYNHAERVYNDEVALYKQQQAQSRKSDVSWIRTVMSTGTLKDKMAALTLVTQDAPVQNLASLDNLISTAKKKGRREALMAMGTLKELFLSELLPDDRKLRAFDKRPLSCLSSLASGNRDAQDKRLLLWYYEAKLREKYEEFVTALEVLCHDNILAAKQKALAATLDLLMAKPEQEKKLLSILTNKLGDPDYKVASKASFLLTKLVERHPNMKNVVVAEVERLMYRPNITSKAQYYGVCFLNQIILSHYEADLAVRLINIYFSFFKAFVKKGDVDSKMLRGLLTGVNRAYHYAKVNAEKVAEQMDTLYKIVHIVNFNTSIQALMLLYQVMDTSESTSDRYYQALYKKLSDPDLITSSKQAMFLNLLFKSLRKDEVDRRVKAFIKRLLQVCCILPPPFICGSLVLLSEILKAKPSLLQFFQASGDEDEEEHFSDIKMEKEAEEDEEEHFEDVKDEEEDGRDEGAEKQEKDVKDALSHKGHITVSSWVHRSNTSKEVAGDYDPHHRNPLYCHAESEGVWELGKLCNHFHPSVALYAQMLMKGQTIEYSGDPLEDFTLIRFLDRFVFRNPKKKDKRQPALRKKVINEPKPGVKSLAVNTEEYLQTSEDKIPADEKFFYKYYKKRSLHKKDPEDVDSEVDDDEFDDFLDGYEKGLEDGEVTMDFASEFSKKSLKKKKKGASGDESDDESDDADDLDDDLSDEEMDFGDLDMGEMFDGEDEDEDLEEGSDDSGPEEGAEFDEEAVEFSEDDEMNTLLTGSSKKAKSKRKADDDFFDEPPPIKKKGKKSKDLDPANLFAAADEFSHLIDDNPSSKVGGIGTEAMCNKDNADMKQLSWEADRDRWMRGQDWKSRKQRHQKGPKAGGFRAGGKKNLGKGKRNMGGAKKFKKGRGK